MSAVKIGCRVRTDTFQDLRYETGTVAQIDREWAQVLWNNRGLGASWLPIAALTVLP